MREKLFALLSAGALALSLAACASSGEIPGPSPSPSSEAPSLPPSSAQTVTTSLTASQPSSEPSPSPVEWRDSVPQRDYQPWQEGYMGFLSELRAQEWANRSDYYAMTQADQEITAGLELWGAVCDGSKGYCLYDADKDGVPELFIKFGNCEAAYHTRCYTFRDGEIVLVGEFGSGHSSLYADPDKNGFLLFHAHMGYANLYEYLLVDGKLTQGQEIFREEGVPAYTAPDEIVPGAEYIPMFYTHRGGSEDFGDDCPLASNGKALLLPICDWYDSFAAAGSDLEQARTAILAALNGESELYGASGDHFYGDTGRITWEEYIRPGAAYPYNKQPFQVMAHVWLDLNGDGREECVLQLEAEDEQRSQGVVVLSEQDGTVYAYYFGFYFDAEFCTDGTILNSYAYGGTVRLSFWKDQCYEYTSQPSATARPVEWQEGAPV